MPGQILHGPNSLSSKQVTFTVVNAGTIDLSIHFGDSPGSTATANFEYALSGPTSQGGTLCVGDNCSGTPSSVSFSNMPAGEYTLTTTGNINSASSNTYISYSYPGLKKTTTGEIEFYYEGFEDDVLASTAKAHTGGRCNYGRSFSVGFSMPNSRAYTLSWRQWDGSRWVYHEEPYAGAKSFGQTLYVDDIRVLPTDALMTTYTYDPLLGVTSSTDPNNRTTYYEYDAFGRLKAVKDENNNVLKTYEYHYAGQQP